MTKNLHLGPFSVIFENGFLRYFRHGEHEILRMIYFALRDENWATLPMRIENCEEISYANGFSIQYEAVNHDHGKDILRWQVSIQGKTNKISFTITGTCLQEFSRNRAGFCILHPIKEVIGKAVRITHPDGKETAGLFPTQIDPKAPFENIASMSWQLPSGKWARISFKGDVFEMEDQRNWTDASFKTFCTPLQLPRPVRLVQDDVIRQEIILEVDEHPEIPAHPHSPITIAQLGPSLPIPAIGFGAALHEPVPDPNAVGELKRLLPAFLRVEVDLSKPDWQEQMLRGIKEAALIQTSIALALIIPLDYLEHWNELRSALPEGLSLHSISLFSTSRATPELLLDVLLPTIRKDYPDLPVLAGSNVHFVDVNRNRFDFARVDGLVFPINPQVHAFDDASLIENVEAQYDVVTSARYFSNLDIHVSPITLRPRFNPEAVSTKALDTDILPDHIDARQCETFAALWTLGSFKNLAESGAKSVTYFETHGMAGLLLSSQDSRHKTFSQQNEAVFPVFHVFEWLQQFAGGEILLTSSSEPLAVTSLLLATQTKQQLVLVNFTHQKQDVLFNNHRFSLRPFSWFIHTI